MQNPTQPIVNTSHRPKRGVDEAVDISESIDMLFKQTLHFEQSTAEQCYLKLAIKEQYKAAVEEIDEALRNPAMTDEQRNEALRDAQELHRLMNSLKEPQVRTFFEMQTYCKLANELSAGLSKLVYDSVAGANKDNQTKESWSEYTYGPLYNQIVEELSDHLTVARETIDEEFQLSKLGTKLRQKEQPENERLPLKQSKKAKTQVQTSEQPIDPSLLLPEEKIQLRVSQNYLNEFNEQEPDFEAESKQAGLIWNNQNALSERGPNQKFSIIKKAQLEVLEAELRAMIGHFGASQIVKQGIESGIQGVKKDSSAFNVVYLDGEEDAELVEVAIGKYPQRQMIYDLAASIGQRLFCYYFLPSSQVSAENNFFAFLIYLRTPVDEKPIIGATTLAQVSLEKKYTEFDFLKLTDEGYKELSPSELLAYKDHHKSLTFIKDFKSIITLNYLLSPDRLKKIPTVAQKTPSSDPTVVQQVQNELSQKLTEGSSTKSSTTKTEPKAISDPKVTNTVDQVQTIPQKIEGKKTTENTDTGASTQPNSEENKQKLTDEEKERIQAQRKKEEDSKPFLKSEQMGRMKFRDYKAFKTEDGIVNRLLDVIVLD